MQCLELNNIKEINTYLLPYYNPFCYSYRLSCYLESTIIHYLIYINSVILFFQLVLILFI